MKIQAQDFFHVKIFIHFSYKTIPHLYQEYENISDYMCI